MQKSEMRLVLFLLQDKANISKTYRQMVKETGLSLGSVQGVMSDLVEQGFVVETSKGRILRKRIFLIDRWAREYSEGRKKKHLICRFRFLAESVKEHWTDIQLPSQARWGGEPAAFLIDGYLRPQRWDIYVDEESADCLISTGRMIPDPEGEIYVYRRFWVENDIPKLVVYADLLSISDDRCAEAADRIKILI